MSNPADQIRRFVVLRHERGGDVHWDLMIEEDQHLATWRMDCAPQQITGQPVDLVRIYDHPLRFLTYRGPVQDGSGRVECADIGACHVGGSLTTGGTLVLSGRLLNGAFRLTAMGGSQWTLQATPSDDQQNE